MSSAAKPPSTTSFALLGLLAIKPWTTYELAAQMDRGLGRFWPRARSHVFAEPKNLVSMGLARATKERTGRRAATVYTITPKGRRALAAWIAEPGRPPAVEWEQLVKVFFADAGTKEDLLRTLTSIVEWAEDQRRHHMRRARSYLEGEGPFPERMPIHGMVGGFLADFAAMTGDWAARSISIVEEWPDDIAAAPVHDETFRRIAASGRTDAHAQATS